MSTLDETLENEAATENSEIISWEVPEYEKHERSKRWYLLFGIIALAFLIYAAATGNFLFAIIIIIAGFVLILNDARTPQSVVIGLTTEGIIVGRKFFDYDEMQSFAIIYKPHADIKQLYFEFKSRTKHRLSLPLFDVNPLFVRENLLKYLAEDTERTDPPASEALNKILKL